MSAATISNYVIGFPKRSGQGFAWESQHTEERYEDILEQFERAETISRKSEMLRLIDELNEIFESCSQDNWDGYGASAISTDTYLDARKIIYMINAAFTRIPMPELTPEPNGDIAFEWSDEYGRTFVFSIDDNRTLTYAGIFGVSHAHGIELLGDFIPSTIIKHLERLYYKL